MNQATRRAVLVSSGSSLPEKILDNNDLEKMVETSDDWITSRTGIKHRRIASDGQTTATLSTEASRIALTRANFDPNDLDFIICGTVTPEMVFPSTACFIQQNLDNHHCCAFDLSAACSGFTYAVTLASSLISSGQAQNILTIGAETLSRITNYKDRASCILFGDGAGAALFQAQENTTKGVLYSSVHADGAGWVNLNCQAYGSRHPAYNPLDDPDKIYMKINGREIYQMAVRRIVEMIEQVYRDCNICNDDIAMIVPHQMNSRIIESTAKRVHVNMDKMFVNIEKFGNTSAASIVIALDEAIQNGTLKQDDLIILVSFGAGLTWGVNLLRL
ncbi:MAG: ketoacyl-ACP synthase III [Planctomycetes bacterium]|nr:ketoacyl-ACP synthase III [Planctomycetota bacterium]